jgi:ribonuclease D
MSYIQIATKPELAKFCGELAEAKFIAFDTEFISENTYRSQLCLVQVATPDLLAIIDPIAVGDLTPFWQALADPNHQTIVHAGREELGFSLSSIDAVPANLIDVQIAAALIGGEFPAGYGALLGRFLNVSAQKGETRTDWSRRPLSKQQLEYALDDVRYLIPLRDKLVERLLKLGRLDWLDTEMQDFQTEVTASRTRERWRRVSGITSLSQRSLGIARELWRWREGEAQKRNIPARFVLRDDLLVELAKRRTADPKQMRAVRGMERSDVQRMLPEIATHVQTALDLPQDQLPRSDRKEVPNQVNALGQFLSTALTSLCRSLDLAPALVGTASDVRDLIAYRLGYHADETPILASGWRAEVVGTLIDDLLAGKLSIRITDPLSDHPLAFEPSGNPK